MLIDVEVKAPLPAHPENTIPAAENTSEPQPKNFPRGIFHDISPRDAPHPHIPFLELPRYKNSLPAENNHNPADNNCAPAS